MVNRTNPNTSADAVCTETEMVILNHLGGDPGQPVPQKLASHVLALAKLGGYLARKNNGPPGNTVLWRGIERLTDINLGVELRKKVVGN